MDDQYIREQFADIKADIKELSRKLEVDMQDRAVSNHALMELQKDLAQHVIKNDESFKRVYGRIDSLDKPSLWSKVPEKIVSWAVPVLMAAILWALMNGFTGGVK